MRTGLAVCAMPYLLVLGGHVLLPDPAPFALFLAVGGAASVCAGRRRGIRLVVPSGRPSAAGMPSAERMRANLRLLEAELHALEDQRRTELARERVAR